MQPHNFQRYYVSALHKANAQALQKFISFSHRTFFNSIFSPALAAHLQAAQKPTHKPKLAKELQFCQRFPPTTRQIFTKIFGTIE